MSSNHRLLFGAGGGGGGGSFRNRPDNLRSKDSFEALLGICSGPIKGLAPGGLKNLFLNNVPLIDGEGNDTYADLTARLWAGDPTTIQPIELVLGASAGPVNVNLPLTNTSASVPGDWRTAVVSTPGVGFIDLRFIVQQLFNQTKDGVSDLTASIEIELLRSGSSTWVNPLLDVSAPTYNQNGISSEGYWLYVPEARWNGTNTWNEPTPGIVTITGKTTSPYVKEIRIAVPNTGVYANKTWQVRCRLREIDYELTGTDGENEVRRTITWESVAGLSKDPIGTTEPWRGLCYLHIFGKASDQINGIPALAGVYDLAQYPVPPSTVWNPETRVYTGATWDGSTTQLAWTQCPAFQIKGLIEDGLSGISALVPGSTLNKWDVLEASKWFAELVPDGVGGFHPRYSANWFIEQPMQAHELVNYLAGAVGAFCWDEGDGRWRMRVEKPEDAVMVFTRENIVGEFSYSHTDFDSRYNDYVGVFRNRDNDYAEDRIRVHDQDNIDAVGRKHTTIALVGCDNRQEALRRLKLRLLSSTKEWRVVNFTTNRQALLLEPFSTIAVADNDLNADVDLRSTGRIMALNGARTQITLRDTVRLEAGVSYTISITIPNTAYTPETGTQPASTSWRKPTQVITRTITNNAGQRGDVKTLYLSSALPSNTPEFAPFALSAAGLPALPKFFRVLSVDPNEDGETVSVTGIEIYTNKWVESDNVDEDEILGQVPNREVPAPLPPATGPILSVSTFQSNQGPRQILVANWMRPKSVSVTGFRVSYIYNGGPAQLLNDRVTSSSTEIIDPSAGTYTVFIESVDRAGNYSIPLQATLDVAQTVIGAGDIEYEDGESLEHLKPAEGGATNGAPLGSPFGEGIVDDVIDDIADLFETYGSTASAAASAELAEDARDAASLAYNAARLTATSLLPADFSRDGEFWFGGVNTYSGAPESRLPIVPDARFSFLTIAAVGRVIQLNTATGSIDVSAIGALKVVAGRTYKLTARARTITSSGTPQGQLIAVGLNASYAYVSPAAGSQLQNLALNTWTDFSVTVTGTAMLALGHQYLRPIFRGIGTTNNYQVLFIRVEDVSESTAAASSATSALTYRNEAGDYSEAAAVSEVSARVTAAQTFPSTFTPADTGFWTSSETNPDTSTAAAYDTTWFGGAANPVFVTKADQSNVLATRGRFVPVVGRRYRVTIEIRKIVAVTDGRPATHHLGFYYNNGTHTYSTANSFDGSTMPLNTWQTYTAEWTAPAGVTFARARVHLNWDNVGSSYSNGRWEIRAFKFEDITESTTAAGHAQAASNHANTAAARRDETEDFAAAAQISATEAETSNGESEGWAGTSQSFASQSQTYRDQSGGFRDQSLSYSQAASQSEVAAKLTAASLLPSDFQQDGKFWMGPGYGNDPLARASLVASATHSFLTEAGVGRVVQMTSPAGQGIDTASLGSITLVAGRTYRVTLRAKLVSGDSRFYFGGVGLNASYGYAYWQANLVNLTGSYANYTATFSADTYLANGALTFQLLFLHDPAFGASVARIYSFKIDDITESTAAQASAIASASSAQTAETRRDEAGSHATAANSSRIAAEIAEDNASSSAIAANDYRVLASGHAAAAQQSSTLAATLAHNSINRNPAFGDWTNSAGLPANYYVWALGVGCSYSRQSGANGGYEVEFVVAAGQETGLGQTGGQAPAMGVGQLPPGWYVLEAEVKLVSGALDGSGLYVGFWNSVGAYQADATINFATWPDQSGSAPGAGVAGRTYRFAKLVQITAPTSTQGVIHPMGGWSGFGTIAAKTLRYRKASLRAARPEEIRDQTVLAPLHAQVQTQAGVIANKLDGSSAAYWRQTATAGDGRAVIEMVANSSGTSFVAIESDLILRGSAKIQGIVKADGFVVNEGVDLASLVPGQFNSFQSASAAGPWTIHSTGSGGGVTGPPFPTLTFQSSGQDLFLVEITFTVSAAFSGSTISAGVSGPGGSVTQSFSVFNSPQTYTMSSREIPTQPGGLISFSPYFVPAGVNHFVENVTFKVRKIFGKS